MIFNPITYRPINWAHDLNKQLVDAVLSFFFSQQLEMIKICRICSSKTISILKTLFSIWNLHTKCVIHQFQLLLCALKTASIRQLKANKTFVFAVMYQTRKTEKKCSQQRNTGFMVFFIFQHLSFISQLFKEK